MCPYRLLQAEYEKEMASLLRAAMPFDVDDLVDQKIQLSPVRKLWTVCQESWSSITQKHNCNRSGFMLLQVALHGLELRPLSLHELDGCYNAILLSQVDSVLHPQSQTKVPVRTWSKLYRRFCLDKHTGLDTFDQMCPRTFVHDKSLMLIQSLCCLFLPEPTEGQAPQHSCAAFLHICYMMSALNLKHFLSLTSEHGSQYLWVFLQEKLPLE